MQTIWQIYGVIAVILVTSIVSYGVLIVMIRPNPSKSTEASLIRVALKNIGADRAAWKTLAVTASRDVDVSAEALWDTWTRLEEWPDWSPMHAASRWIGEPEWKPGAAFEQQVKLGFPLGKHRLVETVTEVNPGYRVRWSKQDASIKSCHIWSFTLLPNRRVRVSNTEVLHGTGAALLKPLVIWQWQKQFEKSIDALIEKTRDNLENSEM